VSRRAASPPNLPAEPEGSKQMFERFADTARRVVVLAQEEARRLDHNYIGTEHILLGLIREGEGTAAEVLGSLDINLDRVRTMVEEIIGRGKRTPSGHIPFTPRSKKVLELSLRESLQLGHDYIGTEHILLGLIREGEGVAAQVLKNLAGSLTEVRERVLEVLRENPPETSPLPPRPPRAGVPVRLDEVLRRLDALAARLDEVADRLTSIERQLRKDQPPAAETEPGTGTD
jgi:ATP-dependent Clp protease ATP-binding subunit ClpC